MSADGVGEGGERTQRLMMRALDGELDAAELAEFRSLLEHDATLHGEWKRLSHAKEVTDSMNLKTLPDSVWDAYWTSVYNRLERGIGWILASIGAIIVLSYGAYHGVRGLLADALLPWAVKIGILALIVGLVILLVSVARQRIFVGRRDPYKDIER